MHASRPPYPQVACLLCVSKPHLALPLARTAVEQEPLNAKCWLALARSYLALGMYQHVLVSLNGLPPKHARFPENALDDLVNFPAEIPAKSVTTAPERPKYLAKHEWAFFDMEKVQSYSLSVSRGGVFYVCACVSVCIWEREGEKREERRETIAAVPACLPVRGWVVSNARYAGLA